MTEEDIFRATVARLHGDIGIVSARIETIEKQLAAERHLRRRLRCRLRMLQKHHTDKDYADRIREGTAKFYADTERAEQRADKISKKMLTFLSEFTPEQRKLYLKMTRHGITRLVAAAEVTKSAVK